LVNVFKWLGAKLSQRSNQSFEFLREYHLGAYKPNLYGSGLPSQSKPASVANRHEFFGCLNASGITNKN